MLLAAGVQDLSADRAPETHPMPIPPTNPRAHTLSRRTLLAGSIGLAAPWLAGSAAADAPRMRPAHRDGALLTTQLGTLPIVLSAPHGGGVRVPGSTGRTRGVVVRDLRTAEIALLCAQRLTDLLGGLPSLVIAQFSRRDADANRAPDEASECEPARLQYDAFHAALRRAVDQAREDHGRALLLDIHGQSREPDAIARGTRTGRTVSALLRAFGPEALEGPDSILGRLAATGYRILPDPNPDDDRVETETIFNGGHIVAAYGSHEPDGIDAVQLELGADLRTPDRLVKTARDLADATAVFARRYMLPEPAVSPAPPARRPDAQTPPKRASARPRGG